jgi:probable HAF family extracellular repeat protein
MGTLGNAYSTARAINNHGVAVGQSYVAGTSAVQHAFTWHLGGVMIDLNTQIAPGSGWELLDAQDINDSGKIVGGGIFNGHAHAFMLTPVACAADLGGPGGLAGADGALDNNDFIVFIDRFFAHDVRGDVGKAGGERGPDGEFDNNDFCAFIGLFFTGAP